MAAFTQAHTKIILTKWKSFLQMHEEEKYLFYVVLRVEDIWERRVRKSMWVLETNIGF